MAWIVIRIFILAGYGVAISMGIQEISLLQKPTYQNTRPENSHLAVDGGTATVYTSGSCTHTDSNATAWWKVDMEAEYCVTKVTILNRSGCCPDRLWGSIVRVGSSSDHTENTQCGTAITSSQAPAGGWAEVICTETIRGRFISVQVDGILTMCEVKAYEDTCPTTTIATTTKLMTTTEANRCRAGWPIVDRDGTDTPGWTMVSATDQFLCSGQVTKWTYQGKVSGQWRAIVFRPTGNSVTEFQIVGINDIPAGETNIPVNYLVPENERITVEPGDVIGWSSEASVITFNYEGSYNVRWVGGNLHAGLAVNQTVITDREGLRDYSIEATVAAQAETTQATTNMQATTDLLQTTTLAVDTTTEAQPDMTEARTTTTEAQPDVTEARATTTEAHLETTHERFPTSQQTMTPAMSVSTTYHPSAARSRTMLYEHLTTQQRAIGNSEELKQVLAALQENIEIPANATEEETVQLIQDYSETAIKLIFQTSPDGTDTSTIQANPAELTEGTEALLGNLATNLPPGGSIRVATETVVAEVRSLVSNGTQRTASFSVAGGMTSTKAALDVPLDKLNKINGKSLKGHI
ncbi:uncharacterized protein [Amphiura filiformis]|uniref:uncharacterized protein n=1 Tax=Amphiura filiformis TaxID=82378 RepID=UPI003B213796